MITDEPAVLTWMIALAPRPPEPARPHWWRDLVTQAWRAAYDDWSKRREAETALYPAELAEWDPLNPCPRLADFMTHLASGRWSPEAVLP